MNSNKNKTEEEIYIEKGDALYKENLYKEAIAEYNNALKINSRNLVTQLKIAKAKLSDNNLKGFADEYALGEKHPLTQKPSGIEGTAEAPARKHPSRTKVLVRNITYITPLVIIVSFAVWYFINAKESRISPVPSEITAGVNPKMSPEGADLIFGKKENPEPGKANAPVKTVPDKKPTKRKSVDVAKKENAKEVGSPKPVTEERIVKEERIDKKEKKASGKREAENGEVPGFWASLKKYLLSFFKATGHKESGGKEIIRDPLGADKK